MVVIDKSTATKYFGDWKQAMGKTLKMDNVLTLRVAGIIGDAPDNSDCPESDGIIHHLERSP
jgi:putative ABC transport system permease protein